MMKKAFVFPGQGAQKVGMVKDLYDAYPVVKQLFEEADDALGFSLTKLCFEGPDEELMKTYNTQPAILTASTARCRPQPRRIFGPRRCRRPDLCRRRPHRPPPRPVHAGSRAPR